ncbi:11246_t:CDS:2, partial [Dentiscutata erythropus]
MPSLPAHIESSYRELNINCQIGYWCDANESLVGISSSSQGAFRLLKLENPDSPNKPTILSPDTAVILKDRWDSLSNEARNETFPSVSPNFIIELRSPIDSSQNLHQKMMRWVKAGVDEGISIDLITNPPEVRTYTFNPDANKIIWKTQVNPDQVESEVLKG